MNFKSKDHWYMGKRGTISVKDQLNRNEIFNYNLTTNSAQVKRNKTRVSKKQK